MGTSHPPHGSSSTTEGVLRGRAEGNVFNLADAEKTKETGIGSLVGKVKVYQLGEIPSSSTKPQMVIKVEVNQTMAPVLTDLGDRYSPIKSELAIFLQKYINITKFQTKIREFMCLKKATGA